jgi:DNA-binding HxlR family transcriptional regulator
MTTLKAKEIRGLTEFLRRDTKNSQKSVIRHSRALDITRMLRKRGKLSTSELVNQEGISEQELEDALKALDKLGFIKRIRDDDSNQEFIALTDQGTQVSTPFDGV